MADPFQFRVTHSNDKTSWNTARKAFDRKEAKAKEKGGADLAKYREDLEKTKKDYEDKLAKYNTWKAKENVQKSNFLYCVKAETCFSWNLMNTLLTDLFDSRL